MRRCSPCSSVVPIAPWIWWALRTITSAEAPAHAFAAATANCAVGPCSPCWATVRTARSTIVRASAVSLATSVTSCWTAWNFPMGRPNCTRVVT